MDILSFLTLVINFITASITRLKSFIEFKQSKCDIKKKATAENSTPSKK